MTDSFGREIDYLRISVTQRCNFRCAYCGAAQPDTDELSPEQFAVFARAFARAGIKKIRLTGGEPLVRGDIDRIARLVAEEAKPETLAVTTNGFLLAEKAKLLKDSGVDRVNISLDTLDPDCFRKMTGSGSLDAVLEGLRAALAAGFRRVKINVVPVRGVNEDGLGDLVALAKEFPLDVRFIELMPLEGDGGHGAKLIPTDELLSRFEGLEPTDDPDGVAECYTAPGFRGRIGFISPITKKFCRDCSRIRLLSNGQVKPCLGRPEVFDLRPFLDDEQKLYEEIVGVIKNKPAGHDFGSAAGLGPMNTIGG